MNARRYFQDPANGWGMTLVKRPNEVWPRVIADDVDGHDEPHASEAADESERNARIMTDAVRGCADLESAMRVLRRDWGVDW